MILLALVFSIVTFSGVLSIEFKLEDYVLALLILVSIIR